MVEEKLESSLSLKMYKMDDSEESDDDCELSDTSSGEWVCTGYEMLKVKPKPEPEWDVDSFDGREYESDPEDRKWCLDDEDYEKHRAQKRKFFESKGFVYEPKSGNYAITDEDMEGIAYDNVTVRETKEELAKACIKKYNETKNKTVELEKIVRVFVTGGSKRKNYITFLAREFPNGPSVEYQAKVIMFLSGAPPFPILCRPSPISTI